MILSNKNPRNELLRRCPGIRVYLSRQIQGDIERRVGGIIANGNGQKAMPVPRFIGQEGTRRIRLKVSFNILYFNVRQDVQTRVGRNKAPPSIRLRINQRDARLLARHVMGYAYCFYRKCTPEV